MAIIAHVEDNELDHILLKEILGGRHDLLYFSELEAFLQSKPECNLIIADLRLPGSYGFETIDEIHKIYQNVPVVILTGMAGAYMTGDIAKDLIERGAINVISKDLLNDHYLTELIENILSR